MKDSPKTVKEKVIIYALGQYWKKYSAKLISRYDIVACSDKDEKAALYAKGYPFVRPDQIGGMSYDNIILGCKGRGTRESLAVQYGLPADKIFYYEEVLGNQIRKKEKKRREHAQKLTVVIPTYNRKQRLQRTLDLLKMQSEDDFNMILLDNCSEYSVEEIVGKREKTFRDRITVVHNKANIGMAANLANAFVQKTEGWVWMLSDDDLPSVYAVEDIYGEIEQSGQAGVIHFSIFDLSAHLGGNGKVFYSLHELMDFYDKILSDEKDTDDYSGDFIYFSNKVFQMEYIKKYYEKIFCYAYSGVPQLVPILFMLNESAAAMKVSNKKIVSYDSAGGDHWDWIKTVSGMRIITDFPLSLSTGDRKTLYRLIMDDYIDRMVGNIGKNGSEYAVGQIKKIYDEVYCHSFSEKQKQNYQRQIKALMEKNL